ncbi:MAG: hypothetical protein A2W03_02215 [Candidatus Aminicenantes bacterium RBG_16_63_16]|nr:MAG: hypothetical protein A2W03_02215 [Candidatus Aminicenantes bacterium RBG_16_63_16]
MSSSQLSKFSRRDFLKSTAAAAAGLAARPAAGSLLSRDKSPRAGMTTVALIKTNDRRRGVEEAMKLLQVPSLAGRQVLIKPNFNTADPAPGSTHNDTLGAIVGGLRSRGAVSVTVGERSGPPETKKVLEDKGILALGGSLGFGIINFEELAEADWVPFNPPGNHWEDGFFIPKPVVESDYIVSTCCLKTHAYGGVFTMSLKLAVGLTPKRLMRQLHRSPDQRQMIAEINQGYTPALIILDGVEAFVDGGPSQGTRASADVFIAGTDRVAVDAVGLAVLKDLGSNAAIMKPGIFEQEQIRRAAELGLGVSSPDKIRFVTPDRASANYADRIEKNLS